LAGESGALPPRQRTGGVPPSRATGGLHTGRTLPPYALDSAPYRRSPTPKQQSSSFGEQDGETAPPVLEHPEARTKEAISLIEESLRQGAERAKGEVHHRVPRCLLRLRDRADAHTELDGEGLQRWLDYEFEALRWNVDSDVSREVLAALVEGSTMELDRDEHREIHAGDFARWGRRGGLATVRRYGTAWFSLLAKWRWEKISGDTLAEAFAAMNGGRP
jgi:hypothetical protein